MPRPRSAPDLYLLGKVSALYYLRDQTQQEIAERLRLSRPTVSRLLRDARDLGFVQITVASPRATPAKTRKCCSNNSVPPRRTISREPFVPVKPSAPRGARRSRQWLTP